MVSSPMNGSATMSHQRPGRAPATHWDYSTWSIEELWELASQMRVTGARSKSRRELIELFAVPPPKAAQR